MEMEDMWDGEVEEGDFAGLQEDSHRQSRNAGVS